MHTKQQVMAQSTGDCNCHTVVQTLLLVSLAITCFENLPCRGYDSANLQVLTPAEEFPFITTFPHDKSAVARAQDSLVDESAYGPVLRIPGFPLITVTPCTLHIPGPSMVVPALPWKQWCLLQLPGDTSASSCENLCASLWCVTVCHCVPTIGVASRHQA